MRVAVVAARVAIVAVLAGLLAIFTTGASGEKPGQVVRSSLAGESVRLTYPTGEPKGLAIWFHGQGGNVNDRIDGPFLSALRRDGWVIASSNFHAQSWGNEASTEDTRLLVEWAQDKTGLPVTLWVSGSMGGSVSLNALTHDVAAPACWYGVKPAINLRGMQNVPTAPRFIGLAYGGNIPPDRNPVDNVDSLPLDVRYRVVASPDDQWVPLAENAGTLASQLDARGADITYLPAEGPHEDPSHWNADDLVDFADSCL